MKYTQIPGSLIQVSRICLGTMTFGTPVGEQDAIRLVRYAKEACGINFIDTANMYEGYARYAGSAGGVAEEIVGKAVSGSRHDFVIATKVGMKVGTAPEDENTSPQAIHIQLERSLKRMQTDYVDVYYLHRYDPNTDPHDIARAVGKEISAGRVRTWGVSNYNEEQLQALIDAVREENVPMMSLCEPPLSLLNQGALEKLIPLCVTEGIGVVPYQVLQGGMLTGKYHRDQAAPAGSRMAEKPEWMKPMSDEAWKIVEEAEKAASSEGITMTQYALKWSLCQPGVVSTLVGVKRQAQIDEAAKAAEL